MSGDLYAELHGIIRVLREHGRTGDAESLDRAMAGSTGTEILTHSGAALVAARKRRPLLPAEVRDRMKRVLRGIDRTLRHPG